MEERVAVLETEVKYLKDTINKMDGKLDELLQLRSKGVGAFWLASALLGTSIIGLLGTVFDWFKA